MMQPGIEPRSPGPLANTMKNLDKGGEEKKGGGI